MSLPPLPKELAAFAETQARHCALNDMVQAYGQACRVYLVELVAAVHKAKGRYHSQIVMCDLYDACRLPNTRPTK